MNYKLALELKESGFPQYEDFVLSADDVSPKTAYNRRDHRTFDSSISGYPKTEPDYYDQGKWRPSCIFSKTYLESEEGKSETLYFPDLQELIEACGDRFTQMNRSETTGKWYAYAQGSGLHGVGSTPEEAVARLWLTLNRK